MFPRDNSSKIFTVMHNPVFELSDTLSFALLVCIILYINGKQFRCSVFTFGQHTSESMCTKYWLTCLGKKVVRRTDRLDMTIIAIDWDVKPRAKQNLNVLHMNNNKDADQPVNPYNMVCAFVNRFLQTLM